MSRRYLFAFMLVVGYLLSSCNGTKNKINDKNTRDTISVDLSIKPGQVERKHKVIPFESVNVDSIIGRYHVLYKTQDNGQVVTKYPIIDGKGKDTVYYACRDMILTINKDGKDILLNRKIQQDDFRAFIPEKEIVRYSLSYFSIREARNNEIVFEISFCVPDTDVCYWFELIVLDNGDVKINEIIVEESDM
ncbi:DUF4738 domain-containing protein [Bacteroides graminisolvens]|uniref:DUF4738 domain-containing protein n=1 Tax=Bacteroides graminisolvens TaxID=477666 RepID=UPI0004281AD2|nr:DUF4738 domain-containing protein [Bacteroides graminisolvens]